MEASGIIDYSFDQNGVRGFKRRSVLVSEETMSICDHEKIAISAFNGDALTHWVI